MRKKRAPENIPSGEPVVMQPVEGEKTRRGMGGLVPAVLMLALLAAVLALVWSRSRQSSSPASSVATRTPLPSPTAVFMGSPLSAAATSTAGQPTPMAEPPTPAASGCQPGIVVGKTADVAYAAVRVRLSPGYIGKNDATDSVHFVKTGDVVHVKGGPEVKDGLCWWLVKHAGYEGWTADHSRHGLLLLSAGP